MVARLVVSAGIFPSKALRFLLDFVENSLIPNGFRRNLGREELWENPPRVVSSKSPSWMLTRPTFAKNCKL